MHYYSDPDSDATPSLVPLEWCPECGGHLRTRRNRREGNRFLGCSRYPRCNFTEDIDQRVARLCQIILALETELAEAHAVRPAQPADVVAKRLRGLIAFAHPDRWPENPLAHEVTVRLTALRAELAA